MKNEALAVKNCGQCSHIEPAKGEMGALGFSRCKFLPVFLFITESRAACERFSSESKGIGNA
jgi:hypothetical protein